MAIRHQLLISLLLPVVMLLAWMALMPGLSGSFLFDDAPNLEKLGSFGSITNWELFRAFVFSGGAGPLGRPISLASFLINSNEWPADPASFKYTNIMVHLLIGVILFPTIRKLIRALGYSLEESDWASLLAMALWLFNPFLVSTTLYVIQRMTQLTALFSIIGIWAYLTGKSILTTKPFRGYIIISLSILIATSLASYSKENGILLPTLILVIEFALYFHWRTKSPDWRWQTLFLLLPTMAIIAYLMTYLPNATKPLDIRNFTIVQRLLTEPRILLEYLYYLFLPHTQTKGLYQDGIILSTNAFSPWTTLPSLFGLVALIIGGCLARKKTPLISLALLFFFGGHLLESTTIPLELYFEHRNYLPSIFLFLPISIGIVKLWKRKKPLLSFTSALIICLAYLLATWQNARLWGNEDQLMLVWAETNPRSARAQNSAVQTWVKLGQPDKAIAHLESSIAKLPDSPLLLANSLSYKASLGILSPEEFTEGVNRLRRQPFDAQILKSLNYLVETLNANAPAPEHTIIMMKFLQDIQSDLDGRVPIAHRYMYYLQGLLMSGQGDADLAYEYFNKELAITKSLETSLHMVSVLAIHHHFHQAIGMLGQAHHLLETTPDSALRRRRSTYEQEISRLSLNLQDALNSLINPTKN